MAMEESTMIMDEIAVWRSRKVQYWGGRWERLIELLPQFEKQAFSAVEQGPANPFLEMVVRRPRSVAERAIPVGVVSHSYSLVQHRTVAELCLDGIAEAGIKPWALHCELGLSELGEWMNLRVYFPREYDYGVGKDTTKLRLECFNSVEGSGRLVILLGWFRLICSNGLIVGESKTEVRSIHNSRLSVDVIPGIVTSALGELEKDIGRLNTWKSTTISSGSLQQWVNGPLTDVWGKKAACRVFHICRSGHDVAITDPFAPGLATQKPIRSIRLVPGSPENASNLYDVSQAMGWVASGIANVERRLEWQTNIPNLLDRFPE